MIDATGGETIDDLWLARCDCTCEEDKLRGAIDGLPGHPDTSPCPDS